MALHGDTLLVGEHGTGKIIALNKTTGAKLGEITTGARKLFGLAVEPVTGDVWFVDGGGEFHSSHPALSRFTPQLFCFISSIFFF